MNYSSSMAWGGDGIDPEIFVSSLYISVAIKGRLLKFSTFNRCKIDISKTGFNFFLTSKLLI